MTKNKHIDIVKRRLWCSGYRVSERSRETDGYDLLVNGKTKVMIIGVKSPRELSTWRIAEDIVAFSKDGGVLSIVFTATFGKPFVGYAVKENSNPVGAREAFGLPESKKDNHGKKNNKKVAPKGSGEEASA